MGWRGGGRAARSPPRGGPQAARVPPQHTSCSAAQHSTAAQQQSAALHSSSSQQCFTCTSRGSCARPLSCRCSPTPCAATRLQATRGVGERWRLGEARGCGCCTALLLPPSLPAAHACKRAPHTAQIHACRRTRAAGQRVAAVSLLLHRGRHAGVGRGDGGHRARGRLIPDIVQLQMSAATGR